jgi:hypothetical protein
LLAIYDQSVFSSTSMIDQVGLLAKAFGAGGLREMRQPPTSFWIFIASHRD